MRIIHLISILLLLVISSCRRDADPEIFLVRNNYKGVVIVLFDQQDGSPMEFEGNKRIYRIPQDGILKTPFSKTIHGRLHQQIFYVNERNEKIFEVNTNYPDGFDSTKIYMMNGVYGNFHSSNDKKIDYRLFALGNYHMMDSLRDAGDKKIQEIISVY